MYKIAVCDDNQECLDMVKAIAEPFCREKGLEVSFRYFSDSDELLELIEEKRLFDAYFLDVDMPHHSGLELVRKIRNMTAIPLIVLLTGYETYAVEACGLNIFKYVLKAKWKEEAGRLLTEMFARLSQVRDNRIYLINNQRRYVKFMHREILYIIKEQKNAVFILEDREREPERDTLRNVHRKLDNPSMYFLDRTMILNVLHIRRVEGNVVVMDDGYEIYSGDENIRELKNT